MMKLEELKQIIKGQMPPPRVFLLWGEEAFLKAHYKKQLTELLSPDVMTDLNVYVFEGKSYSTRQVDEAIEALPVMADKKLLVFNDSLIFRPDGRTGAKAEYRDYWAERLKDIPDYVSILFDESEIDKRSALLKQVDKMGACVEFAYMTEEEMVRWTVRLFANLGKQIDQRDARYFRFIQERLGHKCGILRGAINRFARKICKCGGGGYLSGVGDQIEYAARVQREHHTACVFRAE